MKGWLDNYNDSKVSAPEGFQGEGYSTKGRNYSPAWGGQFQMGGSVYPVNYVPEAQMGASIPGAVGFSYARTINPAPSNGKYAKKTMASAQNGIKKPIPSYQNFLKSINKDKVINLREEPREIVRDNTRVVFRDEKGKQREVNPNKPIATTYNRAEREKALVAERKAKIADSVKAQDEDIIGNPNWREVLARETQATGDKFRLFPEEDSFFDNYLNPGVMIGNMASGLGQAPLQAQQQDSYMPYVTSIGTPLAVGALGGLGTKSTGQFVNNLVNPLAGTRDVFNNIRPPRNILVDEKYMGNNAMFNALDDVKSTTLPSKTKLNELREAVEYDELWKYPRDLNPADEIERLKKAAKTEADVAYINALEKQYDKNVSWHDASRNRANPVFVTGQSIEDLVNPAFKNPEGDQWFAMQPYKYTAPKGKSLGYIADEADYIFGSQYRLPGNRFDTEAMLRDMGESANESFNSMYKPFNVSMKDIPMNKDGGVIKDDRGQWAHPGEITEIGSNQITMQGVPYPVLGVSDEGDVQMMYPEEDYEFIGNTVTEYPMAQNGAKTTYPWSPGNKDKNRGDHLANFKNQPQQEKPKTKTFVDKLIAEAEARRNNINLRELPPLAVNDNIPNAHNMAVKADAAFAKQQQHEKIVKAKEAKAQAEAQKKFNALPKAEQERIINEQRNQQYGSITQYEPEGFWEKAGNIALAPFTALREKIQTGHVPDNLVKGIMNDPKNRLNPLDVAYLGTLGYAAAPYVAQGTTAVGTAVAPYLAADAVIGGTTLTGVNANNLITAGFATHGLINAGPDTARWAENPTWENAGHVAMDVAEILPVAGSASKMIGEGYGFVKNKANQALAKASEVTAPVMTKGKTLIDDMGAVISGERKTIDPKLEALSDAESKLYQTDEYTKFIGETEALRKEQWALEAKMNNLKTKGNRTQIDNLNNKITNLQKRIDVAEQFKVNGDGLIQSGKDTSLGLRTGSTDIMDLSTGEKFPISTSVPTSDIVHTLEGDKVVKTLDSSTLPQVTPEYGTTVKKNIDFIETQIPGAKVFGSAKNVAEAEVPHIIGDYDVIMSQSQYNKFAKANPAVGNNGLADLHNIPGAAKGVDPIDINVIQEQGGKAIGTRAEELFKQVAPDEYYKAAKQAIKNKSEIKIPYSSQQLVDMTNPTTKSVVDAYESTKDKHINKIDALINYGKPSVVAEGQEQFVKSLVGSKGSIGHQFPVEQLSNAEANVEILDKIGFIGNKKLVAADPERMQLAINDYYMNNSILTRQVDGKKINTIEKAIKEYYPGAGGGNVHGIGQNHVMLGHPYHGDGNVVSMKQLGMELDTKDPMSYINSIEHSVSGEKLFSQEERTVLSNILADIKMDDRFKYTANQSENTSQLIENLPYSEEGKQALYEFAKKTGRTIAKKDSQYGNSTYASTLRDFDEAIDAMQYKVANSRNAIKSYRQRSDTAKYAENSKATINSDLELLPKQFKAIKGYVEGGIQKANERLTAANVERKRISDEIEALSRKAFNNKYFEEISRLKEIRGKYEKEIENISQMRRDLFDRRVHLNKLAENMKTVGILGGGTATLVGAGTIAYKKDQEMRKEWDWTVPKEVKEALRVEEEKKKKEAERNAGKLKKQNGGTITKAKNGLRQEQKGLVNLDNLTNFTNYNKPQPGGWLNKYN
jgi:hypothetical protein